MFKTIHIAVAEFANDTRFLIQQIKPSGACRITDLSTGEHTFSGSVANAWKSVCFKANMDWRTNNTSKWRG